MHISAEEVKPCYTVIDSKDNFTEELSMFSSAAYTIAFLSACNCHYEPKAKYLLSTIRPPLQCVPIECGIVTAVMKSSSMKISETIEFL